MKKATLPIIDYLPWNFLSDASEQELQGGIS